MNATVTAITASDQAAIPERARGIILAQWQELLKLRSKVLKNPESETIHDLRVASRRLRAAVELFAPWLPAKSAARLDRNIRKLTKALGALRNIDEALLFFRAHDPAESARKTRLIRTISKMRAGELAHVRKTLDSFDHLHLNRIVQKIAARVERGLTAGCASSTLPAHFSANCTRLYQPIHDLLPAATYLQQRGSRHALRIAIKKWRYFFETVAPLLGTDVSRTVDLLKEYQSVLGRMNDIVVFGALRDDLALSRRERGIVARILQGEEELLLQKLTELIKQKPLLYTSTSADMTREVFKEAPHGSASNPHHHP